MPPFRDFLDFFIFQLAEIRKEGSVEGFLTINCYFYEPSETASDLSLLKLTNTRLGHNRKIGLLHYENDL